MDLQLLRRVTVRTEAVGNALVVHVPSSRGDGEAALSAARLPPRGAIEAGPATTIVRLSYADVSEVAGILSKGAIVPSNDAFAAASPFAAQMQSSALNGSSSSNGNSSVSPNSMPTYVSIDASTFLPKDTPQGVRFADHIAVDRRLNAIILTGTPREVSAYRGLITALDVPTRSVLLETQIVELTSNAAKDLGIDYSPLDRWRRDVQRRKLSERSP
jgi:general secretion pathway protein D